MSKTLVDRITEVQEQHQLYHEYRPLQPCAWFCRSCDFHGENYHDACVHVAQRVAEALQLTEETQHRNAFGQGDEMEHRWVSAWTAVEPDVAVVTDERRTGFAQAVLKQAQEEKKP